jgi:DNA-binding NarL/FixJ family response regulator
MRGAHTRVRKQLPAVKLVLLTMNQDTDYAAEAFRVGVHGYLLKNSAGSELGLCLRTVCAGKRYLTPKIAHGSIPVLLLAHMNELPDPEALSHCKREVLQLLAEGNSMKGRQPFSTSRRARLLFTSTGS